MPDNTEPEDTRERQAEASISAIGRASEWVTRILTVVVLMVGPGIAGSWADGKLETRFLAMIGFAFGLVAGIYYLLKITKAFKNR